MQEGWRATIPVNEPAVGLEPHTQPLPHLQRRLPLEIVSLVCMPGVPRLVFLSSPPRRTIHERALGGCGFRDGMGPRSGMLVVCSVHACMRVYIVSIRGPCCHCVCTCAQSRPCGGGREGGIHNYTELRSTSGLLGGGSRNVFAGWGERFPGVIRRDSDVKREHLCLHGLDASRDTNTTPGCD